MRRSRFSDVQITGILKEHQAGMSPSGLCRRIVGWATGHRPHRKQRRTLGDERVPHSLTGRQLRSKCREVCILGEVRGGLFGCRAPR